MAVPVTRRVMTHALKIYREAQSPRLSQANLAEKLGVARFTIIRWESGDRKIDDSFLPEISKRTGIPAKELRPDLIERLEQLKHLVRGD